MMNSRTAACVAGVVVVLSGVLTPERPQIRAQEIRNHSPSVARLTDAGWAGLLDRLDGVWTPDDTKAYYFNGLPAPDRRNAPHTYTKDTSKRGIHYSGRTGHSFQILDGIPSPGPGAANGDYAIARWPIDEFTTENVTFRNGKPAGHLMQFLAADGTWKITVQRPVGEGGGRTVDVVGYYKKDPSATRVSTPAPERGVGTQDSEGRPSSMARLTDAEWTRLLDRLDGVWKGDPNRTRPSLIFGVNPPIPPGLRGSSGHIYIKDTKRRGFHYNDATGNSFQALDGTPYPGPGAVNGDYTIARWPIDEFTVENVTFRNGKPTQHLMQFLAADGSWRIIVNRLVSERGDWTVQAINYSKKAPPGTPWP